MLDTAQIMYDLKLIQGKVSLEDPDTFENSLAALKVRLERTWKINSYRSLK